LCFFFFNLFQDSIEHGRISIDLGDSNHGSSSALGGPRQQGVVEVLRQELPRPTSTSSASESSVIFLSRMATEKLISLGPPFPIPSKIWVFLLFLCKLTISQILVGLVKVCMSVFLSASEEAWSFSFSLLLCLCCVEQGDSKFFFFMNENRVC
jgi:hypothetical protein